MDNYILWDASPYLNLFGNLNLRWYSVLISIGFVIGFLLLQRIFKKEKVKEKDYLLLIQYAFFSTIIGLRLGHCFFYEPAYYLKHPLEVLMVWKGGLASHGAAIGILIGMYLFVRKHKKSYLWILDRLVIVICIIGAIVRIGNLMNSEIIGSPTQNSKAFLFVNSIDKYVIKKNDKIYSDIQFEKTQKDSLINNTLHTQLIASIKYKPTLSNNNIKKAVNTHMHYLAENKSNFQENIYWDPQAPMQITTQKGDNTISFPVYAIPRWPSQLIESIFYTFMFFALMALYFFTGIAKIKGVIFSIFLTVLWSFRFLIEFLKADQVEFEAGMQFNMGQMLSIPFILAGISLLIYFGYKKIPSSFDRRIS
jgi:prolipoprotein diacylglyceryl transferase